MQTIADINPRGTAEIPDRPLPARLAVAACFLLNGTLFATWVSRIPALQTQLGLNHGLLGLLLLGMALGALLGMPATGWCIHRFGSRRVTQGIAVLYCLSLPWLALAPSVGLLALALFVFGCTHGAFDVAMNAQAVVVEEQYRRPIMSSFHALWSVGGLVGAAIGALAAGLAIPPATHFLILAFPVGGLVLFAALPRLADSGEPPKDVPEARVEHRGWQLPASLLALGAIAFCVMMAEGAIADWSAIYLREIAGASEALAAAGYAAFSVTMALTRFSGDGLAARFGPSRLVRIGGALAAVGLLFALILGQPATSLIGFAAVGAGLATIIPQVISAAGRTSGIAPGPALAAVTTCGYAGFLVGPPLIGGMAEWIGLRESLGVLVVTSFCASLLAGALRNRPDAIAQRPRAEGLGTETLPQGYGA